MRPVAAADECHVLRRLRLYFGNPNPPPPPRPPYPPRPPSLPPPPSPPPIRPAIAAIAAQRLSASAAQGDEDDICYTLDN
eukprot:scaffold109950_cov58-Phaeocystis_antarctica.AAC.2